MKKTIKFSLLLLAAAGMFALASCEKEEETPVNPPQPSNPTFEGIWINSADDIDYRHGLAICYADSAYIEFELYKGEYDSIGMGGVGTYSYNTANREMYSYFDGLTGTHPRQITELTDSTMNMYCNGKNFPYKKIGMPNRSDNSIFVGTWVGTHLGISSVYTFEADGTCSKLADGDSAAVECRYLYDCVAHVFAVKVGEIWRGFYVSEITSDMIRLNSSMVFRRVREN